MPNERRIVYLSLAEADEMRATWVQWFRPSDSLGIIGTIDSGTDYYIREEDLDEFEARKRTA